MIKTVDHQFADMKYDLVVFLEDDSKDQIERAIESIPGVVRSESWFISEGLIAPHPGGGQYGGATLDGERFSVRAVPPNTEMIDLEIVEGRDLLPGEVDAVVVNTALAAGSAEMKVGSSVSFRMGSTLASWHVAGIAREFVSPPVAYIPQAFADQCHPGIRNSAFLILQRKDAASVNLVKADLEHRLEQKGMHILGSTSKAGLRVGSDEHMLMIYVLLVVMSGIILVVGGLGLATTMSLNVMERRREMGVIRAIGARSSTVWLIVVTEAVTVGLLSWGLSALAAWPVSKVLGDALVKMAFHSKLDFTFQLQGLFVWLIVSVFFSAFASFLPAWSASQITVREALAYE
jgi:putative ABC transport system permease protein